MSKYESFYELLHGAESIPHKAHLVENFSGDQIDPRWTQTNIQGTGTFAITDAIDEGASIITGSTLNDKSEIDFNNIRQYDPANSIFISSAKKVTSTTMFINVGFTAVIDNSVDHRSFVEHDTDDTFVQLTTEDGSVNSLESTVSIDENWHLYKIELNNSNNILHIDNVLEVTKTTNLPTTRMQPFFNVATRASATKEGRIRYME